MPGTQIDEKHPQPDDTMHRQRSVAKQTCTHGGLHKIWFRNALRTDPMECRPEAWRRGRGAGARGGEAALWSPPASSLVGQWGPVVDGLSVSVRSRTSSRSTRGATEQVEGEGSACGMWARLGGSGRCGRTDGWVEYLRSQRVVLQNTQGTCHRWNGCASTKCGRASKGLQLLITEIFVLGPLKLTKLKLNILTNKLKLKNANQI
jgi:hypothetical protein